MNRCTAPRIALALAAEGASVGLLDADIYGPSVPMMMGIDGRPESEDGQTMEPLENYGVQVMSIGFLVAQDEAMIWRGPMATQALEQLLRQTNWKELDYLIVDMPPGTGDIQLTLSQRVPMTGAVIVTTPQDIALLDAKKGVKMFEKVGVPILGLVENMAVHVCTNCGHVEHIFGADGGKKMSSEYGVASAHWQLDFAQVMERVARVVREMLPKAHFATVYAKPAGRGLVDDFVTEVSQDTWILFPWDTEPQFIAPIAKTKASGGQQPPGRGRQRPVDAAASRPSPTSRPAPRGRSATGPPTRARSDAPGTRGWWG